MKIPVWTVDSFTDKAFSGNPAAVCLLDTVLPDTVKQMIAAELALSETCFLEPPSGVAADSAGRRFSLRWFTPAIEVLLIFPWTTVDRPAVSVFLSLFLVSE